MKILFILMGCTTAVLGFFAETKPGYSRVENFDYPYRVSYLKLTIQHEKLKMAYMSISPEKANGHTIVLLHGKNFNGAYWARTAAVFSKNGYQVIIPDQVGFGKSSKPEHIQYSFQLLAQNTKTLLDTLGIKKAIVLGNSMGGMLAVRFALMYPEMTEKLILEDPIGLEDWKLKVPYQTVENWYAKELWNNYETIKQYQLENYYHNQWKPEYDHWVNMQVDKIGEKDYPKIAWNSALQYDMIFTQPVCYEFNKLKAPTLLIIGKLDKMAIGKDLVSEAVKKDLGNYPKLAKEAARKIPKCKLIELDSVGHLPHIEAYDEFMAAVLWYLRPVRQNSFAIKINRPDKKL